MNQGRRAMPAQKDRKVHPAVLQDRRVIPGRKVHQDRMVRRGAMGRQVPKARRGRREK